MDCSICHRSLSGDSGLAVGPQVAHVRCAADAARSRADLLSLAMQATSMHRSGNRFIGCCPFHEDHSPSFIITEVGGVQRFHCFGASCGVHGDVVDFVMHRDGRTFADAVAWLLDAPVAVPSTAKPRWTHPPQPHRPLPQSAALRYHRQLTDEARTWWDAQGCDADVIAHFELGYCQRCPTYYDPTEPTYTSPSYTIPIYSPRRDLLNIRHRLARPLDPADKYRPETANRGVQLFNLESVGDSPDVAVLEGEKKVMVWWRYLRDLPAIAATSGALSWLRQYRDVWPPLLAAARRVWVIFDPGAESAAERTAALFGRRGIPVSLPEKVDDYLLRVGRDAVMNAMSDARPWRETSLFVMPARVWA